MKVWTDIASVLAIMATAGFILLVGVLMFVPIPKGNDQIVAGAIGLIGGSLAGSAFGFYFGSSKGSTAKDATITTLAGKQ